jgi:hypothetical protein
MCSYAARGLWLDMLSIMGMNDQRRGYLETNGSPLKDPREIARLTGGDTTEVNRLLAELEKAGVFSKEDSGCLYSRRMVRDERLRVVSSAAGSKGGGNPILKKREQPPPEIDQSPEATSKPTFKPTYKPSVAMASGYGSGCGFGNGSKGESEGETPPTVQEVIVFGKSYQGNPDGTPGPIPEGFCKEYHEAKSTQRTWTNKHGVLVDWQREIAGKGWWRDQWATFGKQASKPKPAQSGNPRREDYPDQESYDRACVRATQ